MTTYFVCEFLSDMFSISSNGDGLDPGRDLVTKTPESLESEHSSHQSLSDIDERSEEGEERRMAGTGEEGEERRMAGTGDAIFSHKEEDLSKQVIGIILKMSAKFVQNIHF